MAYFATGNISTIIDLVSLLSTQSTLDQESISPTFYEQLWRQFPFTKNVQT